MQLSETDELLVPSLVLSIDPGVTTGFTLMRFGKSDVELVETGQWGDPDRVWRTIRDYGRNARTHYNLPLYLVIEQFDKRPGVVNPDFTPKYISRDIENNIFDIPYFWQIPAAAMNLVKPGRTGQRDQLHRFSNWYKKKNVHGNDATRHAIVFGVEKLKHRPLIELGWPKPKDNDDE